MVRWKQLVLSSLQKTSIDVGWAFLFRIFIISFQHRKVDFNIANPFLPTGKNIMIHSLQKYRRWQNVRTLPKLGRYWEIYPLCPPDFPRPSKFPSGNLLCVRKSLNLPIYPSFFWACVHCMFKYWKFPIPWQHFQWQSSKMPNYNFSNIANICAFWVSLLCFVSGTPRLAKSLW